MSSPLKHPGPGAPPLQASSSATTKLQAIKFLHTVVWAFFVACILAIPVLAWLDRFVPSAVFAGVVLLECLILLLNGFRCPLTDVAAHYTENRRDNFDIYLPEWLAHYNKLIFGGLYVAGMLFAGIRWLVLR
jgi:hypothetical protein